MEDSRKIELKDRFYKHIDYANDAYYRIIEILFGYSIALFGLGVPIVFNEIKSSAIEVKYIFVMGLILALISFLSGVVQLFIDKNYHISEREVIGLAIKLQENEVINSLYKGRSNQFAMYIQLLSSMLSFTFIIITLMVAN